MSALVFLANNAHNLSRLRDVEGMSQLLSLNAADAHFASICTDCILVLFVDIHNIKIAINQIQ